MTFSVCLNMIVKNESRAIKGCLDSIKPWIHAWVITDTGSTDGTQEIIRSCLEGIPGKLVEVPWVDFAHNRNIALELARPMADYSLFIDADEQFIPHSPNFSGFSRLGNNCYGIEVKSPLNFGSISSANFLLKNNCPIQWKGVIHEYLEDPSYAAYDMFTEGYILSDTQQGHRSSDPEKYLKDARILEAELEKDPRNLRHMFYLGQSYLHAGKKEKALKAFEQRSSHVGFDIGEAFFARFMVGILQEELGMDEEIVLKSFLKTHEFSPERQEPVYKIGQIYFRRGLLQETYNLLKPYVFRYNLEQEFRSQLNIQHILLPTLFSCVCFKLKEYEECYNIMRKLLKIPNIPEDFSRRLKTDLSYIQSRIPYLDPVV